MAIVGMSTLYLSHRHAPYNTVCSEIQLQRPEEERVRVWEIVDNGEHALDRQRVKSLMELKDLGSNYSVHCPFDRSLNIAHPDLQLRRQAIQRMKLSLQYAGEVEAFTWVLHPGRVAYVGQDRKEAAMLNEESILNLFDYANGLGVAVGLENMLPNEYSLMVNPRDFLDFFESTGAKIMVTFDAGHAYIAGMLEEFLHTLSNRFISVHCHDNNGEMDDHLNVGEGRIDWSSSAREIRRKGFNGSYIVEAVGQPFTSVSRLRSILYEAMS